MKFPPWWGMDNYFLEPSKTVLVRKLNQKFLYLAFTINQSCFSYFFNTDICIQYDCIVFLLLPVSMETVNTKTGNSHNQGSPESSCS